MNMLQKSLSLLLLTLFCTQLSWAQLTDWQYVATVDIEENRGETHVDEQFLIEINTADLISNGQMQADGDDIRFASDCDGGNLLNYYIESGINTATTKIWVMVPSVGPFNVTTIYLFSGNAAATTGSNFSATFPSAFISSGNTTLSGTLEFDWFQINAGDVITLGVPGVPLDIFANRIIIEGDIDGNNAGFAGGAAPGGNGAGPGAGTNTAGSAGGGGAYGGNGGNSGDGNLGGLAYGAAGMPMTINMGSGGAASDNATGTGGAGGGSVTLEGFDVDINGVIAVNGQDGTNDGDGAGGGAGGGILIISEALTGAGLLLSDGGDGGSAGIGDGGGAGAGGRIKIFTYATNTFAGPTLSAGGAAGSGAGGSNGASGDPGTISTNNPAGALDVSAGVLQNKMAPAMAGNDTVCLNNTETYTASSIGAADYFWQVTGGTISAGQSSSTVDIDWTSAGAGTLSVIATNVITGCSDTTTLNVEVVGVQPLAAFTNTNTCEGEPVVFTDASTIASGSIVAWDWDFGDGNVSTVSSPSHVYAAGPYTVSLTVTSAAGCSNTTTSNITVEAVPTADFTFTTECLGAATVFTNTTVGGVNFTWDFGDGNTSTALNPINTYAAPGTYTVTLTALTAGGCEDITTKSVVVYPSPVADFSFTNECVGDAHTFTDLSSISSGSITNWDWDFGDGNTDNVQNPTHTYVAAGTYTVQLTVTTNNGCAAVISKTVTSYPEPVAGFTANDECDGTSVNFTNTSTGALTYTWAFGDGTTSNALNPVHTYPAAGAYNVTLTATSNQGCVNIGGGTITIFDEPTADFTTANVCDGDSVQFTDASIAPIGSTYAWDFGDGSGTSTDMSPAYLYGASGTYTVTLTVTTADGCTDVATTTVTVYPEPIAGFTKTDVCLGDAVNFVNTSTISTGTLSYDWDFGDGNGSTDINPVYTYTVADTYTVELVVTSNLGCTDTMSMDVIIFEEPVADFSAANVCDGDSVVFVDNSTAPAGATYDWAFGDGSGASNDVSPSYLYAGPGTYTVTLTITTTDGCIDVTTNTVQVYPEPAASFTSADVCFGETITFVNTSTLSLGTATYAWDFGDGNNSTDINPSHKYDTAGIFTVTLIVTSDLGCTDTAVNTLIVFPLPEPDFSVGTACFGADILFANLSTISFGTMTYEWDFDDGTTDTAENPIHVFPGLGPYDITLTATSDEGCVVSVTQELIIHPVPKAKFTADPVCETEATNFLNLSTISSGTLTHFWEFGDGNTSIDEDPSYVYDTSGTFTASLLVTSDMGCVDSTTRTVTVWSLPDVDYAAANVCDGEEVMFVNLSSTNDGNIMTNFWEFGDGEVTLESSPTHLYDLPGTYSTQLTVTTDLGCVDSLGQVVIVHDLPDAEIRPLGPTEFCRGDSVELSAASGGTSYSWSTGDTTQNIIVKDGGVYSVTVTNVFGCTNSDSILITVWELPVADAGNDTTISKGFSAQLNGSGGVTYEWSPVATLSDPFIANPIATPLETTTYTLTVTDENGCQDTDSVTVTVNEDFLVIATNVITPNDDGTNEFWQVVNITTYPESDILIFDRWGTLLQDIRGYDNTWDGTTEDGEELPEGTYYFVIRFDQNSDVLYKGAVSILR